jgi:hypothetical protein
MADASHGLRGLRRSEKLLKAVALKKQQTASRRMLVFFGRNQGTAAAIHHTHQLQRRTRAHHRDYLGLIGIGLAARRAVPKCLAEPDNSAAATASLYSDKNLRVATS